MNMLNARPTDKVIFRLTHSHRSVLSSVVGVFTNYILKNFPKEYFKATTINTSSYMGKYKISSPLEGHDDTNINYTPSPALGIQVNDLNERSAFSIGNEWHKNIQMGMSDQISMFFDYKNMKEIRPFLDRSVINLTVDIKEQTQFKTFDTMSYVNRTFPMARMAYLNEAVIGFIIPNDLIIYMANSYQLDLKVKEELVQFKAILFNGSRGAITTSFDGASGHEVFTFKYSVNILLNMSEAASADIGQRDHTNESGHVQFQAQLDFTTISGLVFFECAAYENKEDLKEILVNDGMKPFISFPVIAYPSLQLDKPGTVMGEKLELTFYGRLITDIDNEGNIDETELISLLPDNLVELWAKLPAENKKFVLFQGYRQITDGFTLSDDLKLTITSPSLLRGCEYQFGFYILGTELTKQDWETLKDYTPFLGE